MPQEPIEQWMQRVADAIHPLAEQAQAHRWLLRQSLFTHFQRLVTLTSLGGIQGPILDVGAGTGALTLDLAWQTDGQTRITAVDNDAEALALLAALAKRLGVSIEMLAGEASALPAETASQAMTVARYVFQHLPSPQYALAEMRRVTRPGGRIMIIDVDDGVALGEPPETPALATLREAIGALQIRRGGDRRIGRRLYGLMRAAGLEAIQVILMPRVRLGLQHGRNAEMEQHQIERLQSERAALLDAGLITAEAFEAAVDALRQDFAQDRFELDADFIAIGQVPQNP
ncbi:class I SAM-dependent methyltransferase [Acidihalobacter prosperus]|uniref:Methyltransferase domain-containing protein n=1 Tax=Acidihalobacter prosperus TaxID=160660 RepID=A0A1A6C5M3_9GAMM|nr:methyltransferase domain-containing protein [Acidihalobacter prosperus]OBS09849.1 hypothetical protein Thpro_020899 [Acidihalobacter prosperus]